MMTGTAFVHAQTFAPVITTQPASTNLLPGDTAQFSVIVTGTPPFSFQWRKDGAALTDAGNYQGNTTNNLTLTNLFGPNAGFYDVVVTNAFGSVTSQVAELSVNLATPDSFNPNVDGLVRALALQPNGNVLVAGNYTSVGGQLRGSIARLNADGNLDNTFHPDANSSVSCLAVQGDEKILAGGNFTNLAGQVRNYIGRLFADGRLDDTFNPNPNGWVRALAMQADEKVLVSGEWITRLYVDGSLDRTFDSNFGASYSLVIQADGKILLGNMGSYGACTRLNTNGNLDSTFEANPGYSVFCIAVQPDQKLLIGGDFYTVNGQPRHFFARLNADGSLDSSFSADANRPVISIALQADGKILVGGLFSQIAGQTRNFIARLNPDGSLDSTFNPDASSSVYSLAIQKDGKVLVGGYFTSVSGQPRNRIARLHATEPATQSLIWDGSSITWLRGGTSPEIWRATFEYSTNGANWILLGAGTWIQTGWQLTGISLPPNSTLRARGFIVGGAGNTSSWFVETGLGSPLISRQPEASIQSVKETMPVTFDVHAVGTEPLSYQWYEGREFLTNAIPGATNSVLTLANLEGHEAWQYWVTVSNALGTVTSAPATLRVIGRPTLASQSFSATNGAWSWSFFAQTGAVYTLQATPTLVPPAWVNAQSFTGDNSQILLTNAIPLNSNQFFRLKME